MYKEIVQIKSLKEIETILLQKTDIYFTNKELDSVEDKNKIKSLGARYLIKKSILDYLKLEHQFYDIEIENKENGMPVLNYSGLVYNRADEMDIAGFKISISHSKNYISTLVIVEENV